MAVLTNIRRLWGTRSTVADQKIGNVTGNGNIIVQAVNSHVVVERLPALTLIPPQSSTTVNRTELSLLHAAERSIPLVGRKKDLQDLQKWALDPPRLGLPHNISVRTIVGRAGTGKTRLAIELIENLRKEHAWQGGFASYKELTRFQSHSHLSSWAWVHPTLVVVDYAATSTAVLRNWLIELSSSQKSQVPLRILLLERDAALEDGWYSELRNYSFSHGPRVEAMFHPLIPIRLSPLDTVENRRAIIEATLKVLPSHGSASKPEIPKPGADAKFDKNLKSGEWTEPLYLMMAALTAIDRGFADAFSFSRIDLAFHLARRELNRIEQFAPQPPVPVQVRFLKHLSACATLAGSLSETQAFLLIEQEAEAFHLNLPNGAAEFWDILRKALPGKENGATGVQPDIVGEALILTALGTGTFSTQVAATHRLMQSLKSDIIAPILRIIEDFAVWDGGDRIGELVALVEVLNLSDDLWFLVDLESLLPADSLALNWVPIKISKRLVEKLSESILRKLPIAIPESRGPLIRKISEELREIGNDAELIEGVFKGLEFARVAQNLLTRLNRRGRFQDASRIIVTQNEYLTNMTINLPGLFAPRRALLMHESARTFAECGVFHEASLVMEFALEFYRKKVAEKDDSCFLPLARSLAYYGFILNQLKRPAEGLAATQEAVSMLDQLQLDPAKDVRADRGTALIYHSDSLALVGKPAEAVLVAAAATEIFKALGRERISAYCEEMAQALLNQGVILIELNRWDEALGPIAEATTLYNALVEIRPEAAVMPLARGYLAMATIRKSQGRFEEAIILLTAGLLTLTPWVQNTVTCYRQHFEKLAQTYVTLANSINQPIDTNLLAPLNLPASTES